ILAGCQQTETSYQDGSCAKLFHLILQVMIHENLVQPERPEFPLRLNEVGYRRCFGANMSRSVKIHPLLPCPVWITYDHRTTRAELPFRAAPLSTARHDGRTG